MDEPRFSSNVTWFFTQSPLGLQIIGTIFANSELIKLVFASTTQPPILLGKSVMLGLHEGALKEFIT